VSGNPLGSAVIPIAFMEEMDLLVHLQTCRNYWILRDLLTPSRRVHMRCYRVKEGSPFAQVIIIETNFIFQVILIAKDGDLR